MNEVWKTVTGFERADEFQHFQISNFGRVKNTKTGKIKKNQMTPDGYHQIKLTSKGKSYTYRVHRLVALAFIDNSENKREVNHIDGNKTNNNVDNLEWTTRSENMIHMHSKNPNAHKGSNNPKAKRCTIVIDETKETTETIQDMIDLMSEKYGIKKGVSDWFYKRIPKKYKDRISYIEIES